MVVLVTAERRCYALLKKSLEPKSPLLHICSQLFSEKFGCMQRLNLIFVEEGHFYVM